MLITYMDWLLSFIYNTNKQTININKLQYYGKIDTVFTLRNDFFMCPPFHEYKILDNYDKQNIVIKDEHIHVPEHDNRDGAGKEQYHHISFLRKGTYVMDIYMLRTDDVQSYTFVIS